MNINELERLTGITKQNIRFYEKKGLLQEEAPPDEILARHLKTLQEKKQELNACIDVCKDLLHRTRSQTSQPALLPVNETLRKIDELEKKGGKFMSIVQDYKKFADAEHLKSFSFKPDIMVRNTGEFTEALQQYAEENQLHLVILKEGMYPVFRIDGLEYKAERIFDRFGATVRYTLTRPEELDEGLEDISPIRRQVYRFFHGPWFFLLLLFLVMAVSRHSFKWAFLVLAMAGPYLWWMFVRYFK